MVFHPAWGYFARTYKLKQIPIELEGKAPKPAQLQNLIVRARRDKIKVIFVQPQFSSKSARLIAAEIGGRVIVADPLAADWPQNLRAVARQIKAALK
jgi:zinc transport system substrate-binding protein